MKVSSAAVRLAVLAALGFSGSAMAAIQNVPSGGGNSELFFVAQNTTTGAVFIEGLGVTTNQIFTNQTTTSTQAAPQTLGFTTGLASNFVDVTSAASTALFTFLSGTTSANLLWTVMGVSEGASVAQNTQNSGVFFSLFPNAPFTTAAKQVSDSVLAGTWTTVTNYINDQNLVIGGSGLDKTFSNGGGATFTNYSGGDASAWFGSVNQLDAGNLLNHAYSYFAMAINGSTSGGTAKSNLYKAGFTLELDTNAAAGTADVVLVNAGGGSVPIPAAAWLLGSGLLGLVGVGRRRKARSA